MEPGRIKKYKNGAILVGVFVMMVMLVAGVLAFMAMYASRSRQFGGLLAGTKAFWLAEAGLKEAMYKLKYDESYEGTFTPVNRAFEDGSYNVTLNSDLDHDPIVQVGEKGYYYYLLSTGTSAEVERQLTQSLYAAQEVPEALLYLLQTTGNINFQNSTGTINGNVNAVNHVLHPDDMTINGEITEKSDIALPLIDFDKYRVSINPDDYKPTLQSFDQYCLMAPPAQQKGGGPQKWTFSANQTYSGVWCITGDTVIQNNVTINGTVVATGDIDMKNSRGITINPSDDLPALYSQKSIAGFSLNDSTISGVIYADGGMDLSNSQDNTFQETIYTKGQLDLDSSQHNVFNNKIISNSNINLKNAESQTFSATEADNPVIISENTIQADGLKDSTINGMVYSKNTMDFSRSSNLIFHSSSINNPEVSLTEEVSLVAGNDILGINMNNNQIDGLVYADGKIDFTGASNSVFNHTLVTENIIDLKNSNNLTIDPADVHNQAALICGNEIMANSMENNTFNGVIYSEGLVHFTNNTNTVLNGLMLANSNLLMQNSDNFQFNFHYDPNYPILSNIQPHLTDGETTTALFPQKDWRQQ